MVCKTWGGGGRVYGGGGYKHRPKIKIGNILPVVKRILKNLQDLESKPCCFNFFFFPNQIVSAACNDVSIGC